MLYPPVHWYEGMFLRPQHFQAADRHWGEQLSLASRLDTACNYGIHQLRFNAEAIPNGQFEVASCQARFPDGTTVGFSPGEGPGRLDLKAALQKEPTIVVHLAVPRLNLGRANVAVPDPTETPSRYVPLDQVVQDESAGGNAQDIQFRAANVRLLLSTDDLAGYDTLPIARIRRATEMEAKPTLDETYFPPVLNIHAWASLDRGVIRAIFDIVGQKVTVLAEQVRSRGISLAAQESGDLDRIFMLQILNEAWGKLSCLAFVPGVHPLPMYAELCRIVGALAVFAPERTIREFPAYNHDDLAPIYLWAKKQIELLIGTIRNYGYEQRPFLGRTVEKGMRVAFEPAWLGPNWDWYVGINAGEFPRQDVSKLLEATDHRWKLGSEQQVEYLFRNRAEGVKLDLLQQAPRAFRAGDNWIYYKVTRGNAAWESVVRNQTLAIRFQEELVANLATLDGQQRIDIKVGQKVVPLEFSLFAVPKQNAS